jgi:predicted RNA binding protein YcfA (HicA-like mRNA interferase family)
VSSSEKLVEKFVYEPDRITIDDVRELLVHFGYAERKNPGSHCVFHRKGSYPITIPVVKGKHVKKVYVKRIVEILELEGYLESAKGD